MKPLFNKKIAGTLKTMKQPLEEHRMKSDPLRHGMAMIPPKVPPIEPPKHPNEVNPPK